MPLLSGARRPFADALILNGPGTCFILCAATYVNRVGRMAQGQNASLIYINLAVPGPSGTQSDICRIIRACTNIEPVRKTSSTFGRPVSTVAPTLISFVLNECAFQIHCSMAQPSEKRGYKRVSRLACLDIGSGLRKSHIISSMHNRCRCIEYDTSHVFAARQQTTI